MQKITPFLSFDDQAQEAADRIRQTGGIGDDRGVSTRRAGVRLAAPRAHFRFTEAVSFAVDCESQDEVDYYWEKLSAGGDEKAQQCGWLKDRCGLSWQIVPAALGERLSGPDPERSKRLMKALLRMKKIDIDALKRAYDNV